jgi:hypothetical protein
MSPNNALHSVGPNAKLVEEDLEGAIHEIMDEAVIRLTYVPA